MKFIQLVTATQSGVGAYGVPALGGQSFWTALYALADDGTVWMWTGSGWALLGPHPSKEPETK
jgi:hypothetical protein